MTQASSESPDGEVIESMTVADLCRSCGLQADLVAELVDHGILEPTGTGAGNWRFESTSITKVWKVRRLQQDLDLNLPGIALVLSLVEEKARLQYRLAQLEASVGDVQDIEDNP
jgi:chaperone modulatory protein CbpM